MKTFITTIVTFAILVNLTFPQEKWMRDPRTISKPQGTYSPLPTGQENYINPNKTTRFYYISDGVTTVGPNFRVYPTASNQEDELILVRHPLNPNIMFGSANTSVGSTYSQGVYVTTNGGVNWFGSDILNTSPTAPYSDPGPTIDKNGTIIMTTLLLTGSTPMVACYSTNNGSTWSSLYYISSVSSDKNFAGTDDASSSAYYGRSYCVWSNFAAGSPPAVISYTTNGGVSWSSMAQINNPPSGHYSQGVDIRTGPNGEVYVCWAAPTSSSPYTEDFVGFAKSTNGGVSWTVTENAYDENGIRGSLFPTAIRVNGFPRIDVDRSGGARNGWIYIVTAERNLAPAGSDPDVILHRSTDGGTTWSAGIKVNQDPVNNGKIQFFPAIRVDESGAVNVVYYDNRNTTSDSSGVFLSRSTDGGSTWTDIQVSDHNYKPKAEPGVGGGYMGDYIGITSGNGKVWPFWMDDRTTNFQAWTTEVTFGPPPAHDIAVGPFLSFPNQFIVNTAYNIKTKVSNLGTANETGVPIKFFVNGTLATTNNINLNAGAVDSVNNSWTPTATGFFTLMYVSALANDTNRLNDTVRAVVQVLPFAPVISSSGYCRNGLNINIPDNTTIRDTITVSIPNALGLIDVNVKIDTVTHTYDGDLSFNLNHLSGSVSLINRRGGSGDNFINTRLNDSATTPISSGTAPFTGEYIPEAALAGFNGLSPNGAWILSITDNATIDTGYLKAWCITLTYELIVGGVQTITIPNYYALGQNYPNPFNPVTKISYALPKAGNVELKVYDILGREVATLVNEVKQPGIYNIDFNASNLASGIYFYRLESGSFVDVKKMVVVK
jgi:subtilisin-like proprotein convertase family protein